MQTIANSFKNLFLPRSIQHHQYFEAVLGTTLDLRLEAATFSLAQRAEEAILEEIERLELIFSRYLPNSELNRFLAGLGKPLPELELVLQTALEWQNKSGGAFHLGADALGQLWKRAEATGVRPDLFPILEQLQRPWLTIQAILDSGLGINLNAIAKGFIADGAAQKALANAQEVLVNLGGDLVHRGVKPIQVSIANPYSSADNAKPLEQIQICNQGLATSGKTHRGYQFPNGQVSHLLDPRTGQPVQNTLAVSVLAPNAMTADVLATILSVLEPKAGLEFANTLPQIGCCIVGQNQIYRNAFWDAYRI